MPVFVHQSYKQSPNYNSSKSSWHNFENELQFCFRMVHTIDQGINLLHIHTLTSESPLMKTFLMIGLFHNSFFPELDCNFDTSTCGFIQATNDDFDWTRRKGGTLSSGTGPSSDHTSGSGRLQRKLLFKRLSLEKTTHSISKIILPETLLTERLYQYKNRFGLNRNGFLEGLGAIKYSARLAPVAMSLKA